MSPDPQCQAECQAEFDTSLYKVERKITALLFGIKEYCNDSLYINKTLMCGVRDDEHSEFCTVCMMVAAVVY